MNIKAIDYILKILRRWYQRLDPLYQSYEKDWRFVPNQIIRVLLSPFFLMGAYSSLYLHRKAKRQVIKHVTDLCGKNNVELWVEYDKKHKGASGICEHWIENNQLVKRKITLYLNSPKSWNSSWTIFVFAHEYGHAIDSSFLDEEKRRISKFCKWFYSCSHQYQKKWIHDPGLANWLNIFEKNIIQREMFADKFAYDLLNSYQAENIECLKYYMRTEEEIIQTKCNLKRILQNRFHSDDDIDWW